MTLRGSSRWVKAPVPRPTDGTGMHRPRDLFCQQTQDGASAHCAQKVKRGTAGQTSRVSICPNAPGHRVPPKPSTLTISKLHNLESIRRSPPVGWSIKRVQAYFVWAKEVTDSQSLGELLILTRQSAHPHIPPSLLAFNTSTKQLGQKSMASTILVIRILEDR